MEYYNDNKGRYEKLVLDDYDLKVKDIVYKAYNENNALNDTIKLYNHVESYYSNVIGIMNNRLQKVIEYYVNELLGE